MNSIPASTPIVTLVDIDGNPIAPPDAHDWPAWTDAHVWQTTEPRIDVDDLVEAMLDEPPTFTPSAADVTSLNTGNLQPYRYTPAEFARVAAIAVS